MREGRLSSPEEAEPNSHASECHQTTNTSCAETARADTWSGAQRRRMRSRVTAGEFFALFALWASYLPLLCSTFGLMMLIASSGVRVASSPEASEDTAVSGPAAGRHNAGKAVTC